MWAKHMDRHLLATKRAGSNLFRITAGKTRAAAWLDARRIRLLAFNTYSNIAVGRS
jgi:hypothetical protein